MTTRGRWPSGPPDDDGESGMATVVVLGIVALLVLASGFALVLGAAISARHRAGAAADFAALAAARQVALDGAGACRNAARVAASGGARLVGCSVRAGVVDVRAAVPLPGLLSRWGWVTARARAGPVAGRYDR